MIPFVFRTNGPLVQGKDLDAPIAPGLRGEIAQVTLYAAQTGSGETVCDIRKHGSSLFAAPARMPRLTANGTNRIDITPRQDLRDRAVSMISFLSVHVVAAPPASAPTKDAALIIWLEPDDAKQTPLTFSLNGAIAVGPVDTALFPCVSKQIDRITVCAHAAQAAATPLSINLLKNGAPVLAEPLSLTLTGGNDTADLQTFLTITRNDILQPVITAAPADALGSVSVMLWII